MLELKCIKMDEKYISFSQFMETGLRPQKIYVPNHLENQEVDMWIATFGEIEIFNDIDIFENTSYTIYTDVIKERFNCLLKTQNILLFSEDDEVACEVPYSFLVIQNHSEKINALYDHSRNSVLKDLVSYLAHYYITKDIVFLDYIIQLDITFDTSLFRYMENIILHYNTISDETILEALDLLNSPIKVKKLNICLEDNKKIEEFVKKKQFDEAITYCETLKKMQTDYQTLLFLYQLSETLNKQKLIYQLDKRNEDSKDKKNLVFIHLESISKLILEYNKHLMPDLYTLMRNSVYFNRHYAPVTSTFMALTSIMYGNDFELDKFTSFEKARAENKNIKKRNDEHLFKILRKNSFNTAFFYFDTRHVSLTQKTDAYNIWDDGATEVKQICDNYHNFIDRIDQFFNENKENRFALMINNEMSHCVAADDQSCNAFTFEEKMTLSYISLNNTIKRILDGLKKNGLYDNTMIVMYGDHGDDRWTRSLHFGASHGTPPFSSIIHTPFCIFDRQIQPFEINDLVSEIDIKSLILYMLRVKHNDTFPYRGKNVLLEKNDYVFSQNLFSNQEEVDYIQEIDMKKLNLFKGYDVKDKSYAVINDSFCYMVGRYGAELYNLKSDYLCYNNLLTFYEFEGDTAVKFNHRGAWRGHFRREMMSDGQIYDTLKNLAKLKSVLKARIRIKEQYIKDAGLEDDNTNFFDFNRFNWVKERGFIFNDYDILK